MFSERIGDGEKSSVHAQFQPCGLEEVSSRKCPNDLRIIRVVLLDELEGMLRAINKEKIKFSVRIFCNHQNPSKSH